MEKSQEIIFISSTQLETMLDLIHVDTVSVHNNHYLNLMVHPSEVHTLQINNSLYHNNVETQRNQFFLDATYRYRVKKWKTDIELTALNLFNNNNYLQQFSTDYELAQSYFELRPRQFLISTRFKF